LWRGPGYPKANTDATEGRVVVVTVG
ncbi:MAG: hypothetical protein RL748_556, partial [Pseudomonadota bacterium]